MKRIPIVFLACLSFFLWSNVLLAAPVDLSAFIAEPDDPTIVNIGTDTITFNEDMEYGYIYAANDAFDVPVDATTLSYDYSLTPGSVDDYDWLVTIIDNNYVMEIERIGLGPYSIDMTPYQGQTISLAFGLEWDFDLDWNDGSVGIIYNLDLETSTPIPVPGTIILLGSGLAGLFGFIRRKKFLKFL